MKRILSIVVVFIAVNTRLHGDEPVKINEPFEKTTATLTPQALLKSIENDIRDPEYRQHFLPNNLSHLLQLLDYGNRTQQPRLYMESTISLFSKLLKGSQYVNAYMFSDFLEQIHPTLKNYFKPPSALGTTQLKLDIDMIDRFQQTVNAMMFSQFKSEWNTFKQDPEQFLDQLTKNIAHVAQEEVSIFQLRQALIKFIEVGLSKLVWSPNDGMRPWEEVKKMLHKLAALMEENILDDINELDDLYWTVTSRFCYFMETMSSDLPLEFYQKIKHDLATEPLLLGEIEEQESFMESKLDYLKRTVATSEAKKLAYDQAGIVTM